jgi:hypothetical protein
MGWEGQRTPTNPDPAVTTPGTAALALPRTGRNRGSQSAKSAS